MKTITELRKTLSFKSGYIQDQLIKEWANQLIDLCAGSFECTMEEDLDDPSCNSQQYPVLVRATVLEVKNKIK